MTKATKLPPVRTDGPIMPAHFEQRVTVPDFLEAKKAGRRLSLLTAYDYSLARVLDEAGVDGLLVGDSLGMVVQGLADPLSVTLEETIYHTRLVVRGAKRSLVVGDMPFMTYQVSTRQALRNAGRLVKESGAHAVKVEGDRRMAKTISVLNAAGIPVMAHIGLTPQSVRQLGGFRVQRAEGQLLEDARAVEEAGAFAVVVECVPSDLARKVTEAISIPTIGIGAGAGCDGQILVAHDMLGLFGEMKPKFVKAYANLGDDIRDAVQTYCRDVQAGKFPAAEHEFR